MGALRNIAGIDETREAIVHAGGVEAIVRARGKVLLVEDLEKVITADDNLLTKGTSAYSLEEMENRFIRKTLAEVGWSRTEAAKQLEISLPTLRKKILKYGIEFPGEG